MKSGRPGELVQIDHTTIIDQGKLIKQFTATCPTTKITVHQAYRRATSSTASEFLGYAQSQFPFKVVSIQVDGGSEFMGDFDQLCEELKLPLYVLPLRRPQCNGSVERSNKTMKQEFYNQYDGPQDLATIRKFLGIYIKKYNKGRPNQSIGYLTPFR